MSIILNLINFLLYFDFYHSLLLIKKVIRSVLLILHNFLPILIAGIAPVWIKLYSRLREIPSISIVSFIDNTSGYSSSIINPPLTFINLLLFLLYFSAHY